ncbi:hypothetical protein I317_07118 [Kwoniella heveanensis CBS 569]|uniref:Uncharacterized protein n=1 Tax=Kwoniella heveanensis BCC8398 TaxID=1296120 RepID=A0A1B9GMA1_9TREE|nr:hypothetical protein I316_06071 [Kwoniella heveanensis BCC8398]OCF39094.1 hypothetical protein I317_07118 [Kwoniella heveanensis CBS 569]
MSVILRANTDLVYLPDHGFVGEEGALRILPQITRHIHRLDISHNLLGSAGTLTLFKGLTTLRARYSSDFGQRGTLWGLKEVNLAANGLDDSAFDGVLAYAKKDVLLRRVLMQGNSITLRNNLESIVNSLNASHISTLSLTNNPGLDPPSVQQFFETIHSPHLRQLQISTSNFPSSIASSIADYLRSPRSRDLEYLELNGNNLGEKGVAEIVDAVDENNFSIQALGLLANQSTTLGAVTEIDVENDVGTEARERVLMADRESEQASMEYQIHRRLPILLERNRILTSRIRKAALKTLVPARIVLNALPPSDEDIAQRVISDVSTGSTYSGFRLLDLPEEVVQLIVRHSSGDSTAFSDDQWTRLRREATDKDSLQRSIQAREERLKARGLGMGAGSMGDRDERKEVDRQLREDWLRRGQWDRWER